MSRLLIRAGLARKFCTSVVDGSQKAKGSKYFELPDRLKGTIVDRWATYWKDLFHDYVQVFKDIGTDIKEKPLKSAFLFGSFSSAYYCTKKNPDMANFRSTHVKNSNEMIFIGAPIRNPKTVEHLETIERSFNQGTLRRFSFGLFSIIWTDDLSHSLSSYKKLCSYLAPQWTTFHRRIIDVGFLDKWWILEEKMIDCDINPEEWGEPVEK